MVDGNEWENESDMEDEQTVRSRVEGTIRDVLRRTLNQGAGARAVTEEVIRAMAADMKLPKDVATHLLSNVDTIKNEVVRVIANEVRRFLESANLGEELSRILTSISFEVRTEIRFVPNEDAIRPSVRSKVGIKSTQSDNVIHTGESDEFDQALRAGLSEFIQRMFSRRSSGKQPDEESPNKPTYSTSEERTSTAEEDRASSAGAHSASMQTSAERRQQLRKALSRRRERNDE